jgi:hypothetical protein
MRRSFFALFAGATGQGALRGSAFLTNNEARMML